MPPTPNEIRERARDELAEAERQLADALCGDGDSFLQVFADGPAVVFAHEPTRERLILAARLGFKYEIVRRNAMRSDNAL